VGTVALIGPAEPAFATVDLAGPAANVGTVVAVGTVASGSVALRLRVNASTEVGPAGRLPNGARVHVTCQLAGEMITGSQRRTSKWDRVAGGRFVSDAYIRWSPRRPAVPWCTTAPTRAPTDHAAFIGWAAGQARGANKRYRVPVSVTVAQAILESGWGGSSLTRQGASFFGMKCFGSPGPVALGCRPYPTKECRGKRCYRTTAYFRLYGAASLSFRDHARQLATLPRYKRAFAHTANANRFAVEIHRGGYATSPTYARNLISLMRQYDLYRYDGGAGKR
jgi:flagellar protein FlgJ